MINLTIARLNHRNYIRINTKIENNYKREIPYIINWTLDELLINQEVSVLVTHKLGFITNKKKNM